MKLSIVIVSYNVSYFLEKCLVSVIKALQGIEGEVIVIDNDSSDDSVEVVRDKFPGVHLITNSENVGFAKACNQGLKICRGAYALLLNPDTVVSETTFTRCMEFMEAHPEAGACGVRMVDGTGAFLPESMRGLPTPLTAFFKMTGINALFPNSPFFNGYYMGGRDPETTHAVPVLTGAFMFMRMPVVREVGMLDEAYFMYGEDIDLCYRIIKAGYQNYYLPEPSIIHYKGESTHRGSITYVVHFYRAMLIYVSKHIHGIGGGIFRLMIMLGVVFRGILGGLRRLITFMMLPVADAVLIALSLLVVQGYWARLYFADPGHFTQTFYAVNLPLYGILWLVFLFLAGAHDLQRNAGRIVNGMLLGTVAILVVYAILPMRLHASRAVILISSLLITLLLIVTTLVFRKLRVLFRHPRNIAIVGSHAEVNRIMEILNRSGGRPLIAGWVSHTPEDAGPQLLGNVSQLQEIVGIHHIGELVFSEELSFQTINTLMSKLGPGIAYRIASSGSGQIVGSDSKKEQGTLYSARVEFALSYPMHRRLKRMIDIAVAILLILLFPILSVFGRHPGRKWQTMTSVLKGSKTWVGYQSSDPRLSSLPALQPGVFATGKELPHDPGEIHLINYIYAREYSIWKDLNTILRNRGHLF